MLNENARRGRECGPAVRDALERAGIDYVALEDAGNIPAGVDCIIGAGGDGTITRCATRAVERSIPLGVIPLGTFNDLARTLNLPLDVDGAVAVIARGDQRAIDVGTVNGYYFVNEASIGISSRIARLQTPELKQRFGFLGVIGTAVQGVRHAQPIYAEVTYDGRAEAFKTVQLTVANSHRFGGFLQVEGAAIDDGWLDLYSIDIEGPLEGFAIARAMFSGKRHAAPGLRTARASSFHVHTRHPHHIAADGEPAGMTPATFSIEPKALRVFAVE